MTATAVKQAAKNWHCIKCGAPMETRTIPIPGEARVDRIHVCPNDGCTVPK